MRLRRPWRQDRNPASEWDLKAPPEVGPGASYVELRTHEQVTALATELTDPERKHIVVGITSIPHENVPSIDVDTLRRILPADTRVYFIPSGSLTFRLMSLMPDRRAPYNGAARIWIPGGDWDSDRFRHPQIYDETNEYGFRAIREIAYKLRHTLLKSGLSVELDPVEAYRELEIAQTHAELERLRATVARTAAERDRALLRLRVSESREHDAQHELELLRTRVLGPLTAEDRTTRHPVEAGSEAVRAHGRA